MSGRIIDVTLTAEPRQKLAVEEATVWESGTSENLFENVAGGCLASSECPGPLLPFRTDCSGRHGADLRDVLNAICYLARARCGWCVLPVHFGPWQTTR
jgi:hypothetical protein